MNPGKLNHRIKFTQLTGSTPDEFGGVTAIQTELLTTWGSLEPIKQYQQYSLQGAASILNGDKILIIRNRAAFTPAKDMIFEDLNNAGDVYTIHSILPYWPGTSVGFQSNQQTTYRDNFFTFILGIKRS